MPPITTSTDVDRSAEDVFAYAIDPTRFHEWQQGVVDGHMDQPGIPSVGARCMTTRRIGGADRASTSEVVHIKPPTTWGVRGIDGPIRAIVDVTVEPLTAARGPPRGSQGDAEQPRGPQAASRVSIGQDADPLGAVQPPPPPLQSNSHILQNGASWLFADVLEGLKRNLST
jgi:hypothetical protein